MLLAIAIVSILSLTFLFLAIASIGALKIQIDTLAKTIAELQDTTFLIAKFIAGVARTADAQNETPEATNEPEAQAPVPTSDSAPAEAEPEKTEAAPTSPEA